MQIEASEISKRYGFDWVFRDFNFIFSSLGAYAITGQNGSGKSTLLRVLTSIESPTKGTLLYTLGGDKVDTGDVFKYMAIVAPYQQLIEELTLEEHLKFHHKFKGSQNLEEAKVALKEVNLDRALKKPINTFSSGMKQRLKLILAFYSRPHLLFLDEPTVNLDAQGVDWYKTKVQEMKGKATLIICSNQPEEYEVCDEVIAVDKFKGKSKKA